MSTKVTDSFRFGTRFTNALNASWGFNLLDDAIADLMVLDTACHGTSMKNYDGIMQNGADPKKGATGGETAFTRNVLKDETDYNDGHSSGGVLCKDRFFVLPENCPRLMKNFMGRTYTIVATMGETVGKDSYSITRFFQYIWSIIKGSLVPILKFRLQPEESETDFTIDNTFGEFCGGPIAAFTSKPISADQIGIHGSLTQGFNGKFCQRFKNNPLQFCKGLIKLIISLALLALPIIAVLHCTQTLHWIDISENTMRILKIALIAYGAFKGFQVTVRFFAPFA